MGYTYVPLGIHLRLEIEGKHIFICHLFLNIYLYFSEYHFQNHYMAIVRVTIYDEAQFLTDFCQSH